MSPAAKNKVSADAETKDAKKTASDIKPVEIPMKKAKKGGLSFDEKKERTLDFLRKSNTIFQLKELESILPKAEKVVSQSVKEVIETLVSEYLAKTEQVGSSKYIWSFPIDEDIRLTNRLDGLTAELDRIKAKNEKLDQDISLGLDEIKKENNCTPKEYEKAVQNDAVLSREISELNLEIGRLKERSQTILEDRLKMIDKYEEAADQWTDYLDLLQAYVSQAMSISRKEFFQHVGLDLGKEDE